MKQVLNLTKNLTKFICPGCKKETYNPWDEDWKVIRTNPSVWGIKFCPDCHEEYKRKDIRVDEFGMLHVISEDKNIISMED